VIKQLNGNGIKRKRRVNAIVEIIAELILGALARGVIAAGAQAAAGAEAPLEIGAVRGRPRVLIAMILIQKEKKCPPK
jgi:hypothetical protein